MLTRRIVKRENDLLYFRVLNLNHHLTKNGAAGTIIVRLFRICSNNMPNHTATFSSSVVLQTTSERMRITFAMDVSCQWLLILTYLLIPPYTIILAK